VGNRSEGKKECVEHDRSGYSNKGSEKRREGRSLDSSKTNERIRHLLKNRRWGGKGQEFAEIGGMESWEGVAKTE